MYSKKRADQLQLKENKNLTRDEARNKAREKAKDAIHKIQGKNVMYKISENAKQNTYTI